MGRVAHITAKNARHNVVRINALEDRYFSKKSLSSISGSRLERGKKTNGDTEVSQTPGW